MPYSQALQVQVGPEAPFVSEATQQSSSQDILCAQSMAEYSAKPTDCSGV